jgi:acetyl esterase/lipase
VSEPVFHPDLRLARFLPRAVVGPRSLRAVRALAGLVPGDRTTETVPLDHGVTVRLFRPRTPRPAAPALLWIHGGGFVIGSAAQDDAQCRRFAERLNIVVASVDYRLAPEHPFPIPLEDCYTALAWLARRDDVDSGRIAIGGASAGGGLAAGLALLAVERGEIRPAFQLLSYPMLDDRSSERTDVNPRHLRVWSQDSNRFGWRSYLGPAAGRETPQLAAPARYADLAGLPPAWIGVGTRDLFHDEDLAYAHRLRTAGVPCEVHVVPGAYHGFDGVHATAQISRDFLHARTAALESAINR